MQQWLPRQLRAAAWAACIDKQPKALAISGVVRNKLYGLRRSYAKDRAYSDSKRPMLKRIGLFFQKESEKYPPTRLAAGG